MKRTTKRISVTVLCIVMLVISIVPAFAVNSDYSVDELGTVFKEDHSIIDCTYYHKGNNGLFSFGIQVPKGMPLDTAFMQITGDSNGTLLHSNTLNNFSEIVFSHSDEGYDYYDFVTAKYGDDGVGIKLFCEWNGDFYRATNTYNNNPEVGSGYWVSE